MEETNICKDVYGKLIRYFMLLKIICMELILRKDITTKNLADIYFLYSYKFMFGVIMKCLYMM